MGVGGREGRGGGGDGRGGRGVASFDCCVEEETMVDI